MLQLFLSKPYVSVYFFVHIFSQPCFYFVSLYFLLTYTMKVLKLLYCFVTFPFSSQLRQVASVPLIFNGITTTFSKVLYFIQFIEPIYKNLSTRSLRLSSSCYSHHLFFSHATNSFGLLSHLELFSPLSEVCLCYMPKRPASALPFCHRWLGN